MAAIKLNNKAREEARQSLHDMGFIQPEHRKYEIKTNDGRSLGSVSYGAKNAIERKKLDSYVPKDENEKKTLDDFKAYVNEQAEKKKQQRINSNPVTKKYGIDPDNFTYDDFKNWAEEHGFEYRMGGNDLTGAEMKWLPKQKSGWKFWEVVPSKEEQSDKQVLETLAGNNQRKTLSQTDRGTIRAGVINAIDGLTFGAVNAYADWDAKRDYKKAGFDEDSFVSYKQADEKTNSEHKVASVAGNIAGSLVSLGGLSKAVGAATSTVKWIAKAPIWVQSAINSGITFALQSGAETAFDGGNFEDVLKSAGINLVGGAVGGGASSAVGSIGEKLLFDKGLQHKIIPEMIRTGVSSATFAGSKTASTYFLYPEDYRPTKEEMAKDITTAFAFGAISSGINTIKTSSQNKKYLDELYQKMAADYESMAKANISGKNDTAGIKKFAKNVVGYSNAMEAYLTGKEYNATIDGETYTFTPNKIRLVGQDKYVNSILGELDTIRNNAGAVLRGMGTPTTDIATTSTSTSNVGKSALTIAQAASEVVPRTRGVSVSSASPVSDTAVMAGVAATKVVTHENTPTATKNVKANAVGELGEIMDNEPVATFAPETASGEIKRLENILIAKGADDTSRKEIIDTAVEIEKKLDSSDKNIRSVFNDVSEITSTAISSIQSQAGLSNAYWKLFGENFKTIPTGNAKENINLVTEYSNAYVEALKNNNPEKYNSVILSSDGKDLSMELPKTVTQNIIPNNVQNAGQYRLIAAQIKNIIDVADVQLESERDKIYGTNSETVTYVPDNTSSLSSSGTKAVSNAITNTLLPKISKQITVMANKQFGGIDGLAEDMISKYNKYGTIGTYADMLVDKGASVIKAINSVSGEYKNGDASFNNKSEAANITEMYENESAVPYTDKEKQNWENSKDIIVYESDEQFEAFVEKVLKNEDAHKKIYFGKIPDKTAQMVLDKTGIDVSGHNIALKGYEIRKILLNSHGNEKVEAARGQESITRDDLKNIPSVITNPDDVGLSEKEYEGKPTLLFEKNIDGKNYVVAYVSKKHHDIAIQTMYKKRSLATAENTKVLSSTPVTTSSTASDNNISQNDNIVNSSIRNNTEKYDIIHENNGNDVSFGMAAPNNAINTVEDVQFSKAINNNFLESEENKNVGNDLLLGNSERTGNAGTGEQARSLSENKLATQGKTAAERQITAKELLAAGQTQEEIIDITQSGKQGKIKLNLINANAYTSDMLSMAEAYANKGIDVKFYIGNGRVSFDMANNFLVNAFKLGSSKMYIRYDGIYAPQILGMHEAVHLDWNSEKTKAAADYILNSLTNEEKNSILSSERYKNYLHIHNGDTDTVWQEFIADTLAGMNEYTADFAEVADDYWHSNTEFIDSYKISEYTDSIDAGGNEKALDNIGFGNEYSLSNNRFNIPYNEKRQIDDYVLRKNHSSDKLEKVDCKEIGNNFYVWENNSKTDYAVVFMTEIDGNEDFIDVMRGAIENGTYRGTESFNTGANRIRSRKRNSTILNADAERTATHGNNDRLSVRQSADNKVGHFEESSGNKQSENKPKYALNSYGNDSDIYDYTKPFDVQIDDWKQGKIPKYDTLLVGRTPEVFRNIGFNPLPMTINQKHIDYALNGTKDTDHTLGEDLLKQLPKKLEKPIAIIASQTQNGTSVVALLDFTHNGKTVVAPVVIDGYGRQNDLRIDSNAVTSIFGKDNAIIKLLNDAIAEEMNGNAAVYYLDKLKTADLLQRAGLQLPRGLFRNSGYIHSIRENGSNVKPKFEDVTQTQQFKRWFGDWEKSPNKSSKVVNADGTPKIMYHGTNEMFNIFDRSQSKKKVMLNKLGPGNYFTANAAEAERYNKGNGRVISAYLDIKKPFITSNNNASFSEEVASRLNTPVNNRSEISEILKSHGYDGVILHDANGTVSVAVTFTSGQIKSAVDNIGIFDKNNADIRYSIKAEDTDKFETQDLLINIAQEMGYSDNLLNLSKKNKEEFKALYKQNDKLQKHVENANRQMQITKLPRVNNISVGRIVKDVVKTFNSKANIAEINSKVNDIYNEYFKGIKDAGTVSELEAQALFDMMESMQDIAVDIVSKAEIFPENEDYEYLRTYLKNQPITISDDLKSDVNYAEFRKQHFGTLNLTNSGTPVETVYKELCEAFPHLFSDDVINPADQLIKIADTLDKLKPEAYNPYEAEGAEVIQDVVDEFVRGLGRLEFEKPTKADKIMKKAQQEKEAALEKERLRFEQKYDKLKKQAQEYKNGVVKKAANQKYIQFWEKTLSKQEKAEALEAQKEKFEQKYDKLKEHNDKIVSNIRERQKKAALKASIRNTSNKFTQALNGTRSGVPKELVQAVADVCSKLDFHTDRVGKDGGTTKTSLKLDALKTVYDKLKNDSDYDYSSEYDEAISEQISKLNDVVKGKRIVDLSVDELSDLDSILNEIKHTVSEANKQIGTNEARTNRELGKTIIEEFKAQPNIDKGIARKALSWSSSQVFNPMRTVRMICAYNEDAQFYKIFSQINDGVHKQDKFVMDTSKPFEELMSGKGNSRLYYNFLTEKVDTGMKYSDGSPVMLPKSMICELVMLWGRKQGRNHLEKGGFTVPNFNLFNKGKIKEAFIEGQRQVQKVTEGDIGRIKTLLNKYDKLWIERARLLFNVAAQNAINETSLQLKGRKIATTNNYIPIHTDKNYIRSDIEGLKIDATIEGNGSLKSVVKNAPQPLYLMGLSRTVSEHITFVGKYYGLAIPIRNFNKVYNVSIVNDTPINGEEAWNSVKGVIGKKWGVGIKERVIEQTVRDLQTKRAAANDPLSRALGELQSNWVAATLNFNVSVSMKQFASYPTAMYTLGAKPVIKAFESTRPLREIYDEIDKHTGIHYKRRLGMSTQELGDIATSQNIIKNVVKKIDSLFTDGLHIPSEALPSNWIQTVDVFTTAKLWEASKIYVEDVLNVRSDNDNYWNEVTKVYERTIEETQPNYDVLHRPEIQKSSNQLLRALIMFQTQPLQNTGILYNSLMNLKTQGEEYKKNPSDGNKKKFKGARTEFNKAVGALLSSCVIFALMTMAKNFVYHKVKQYIDKDKNISAKKITSALFTDIMSQIFAMIVPAIGNDVLETVNRISGNGYELEVPVVSLVNDFVDAVAGLVSSVDKITGVESYKDFNEKAKTIKKSINKVLLAASPFIGFPLRNAENLFNGINGYIKDIRNGEIFSDQEESYSTSYIYNHTDLAGTIITGNTQKEEKIRQYFADNGREINKGTITKYVKPAYLKYHASDPKKADLIKQRLIENYDYKEEDINKWLKVKETEDK